VAVEPPPMGEVVEQTADGLSSWCRAVAGLVQEDVDRIAAGTYHPDDLTTAGLRMMRINVDHFFEMGRVFLDNLALLAEEPTARGATRIRSRKVDVNLPADKAGTIVANPLVLEGTDVRVRTSRLSVSPSTFGADAPRTLTVSVTMRTTRLRAGNYAGSLSVIVDDAIVGDVPYNLAI
jgi:hypothetical protein